MPRPFAALRDCARHRLVVAGLGLSLAASPSAARAISLQFDYTYDAAGFFGTAAAPTPARAALEFAARSFTPFTDVLAPVAPGGGDRWNAQFRNPGSGGATSVPDLAVPPGVVVIFAGARNLAGSKLGEAGPGSYSFPSGGHPSNGFADAVINRGQGPSAADFAPWGGFIEFDTIASGGSSRRWHYDLGSAPAADAYDFYTVALHELAHLLGFGTSTAFVTDVAGGQFVGPAATAFYGGPAPLHTDSQHWSATVGSPPYASPAKPSLGPSLAPGERKLFTPLDYAAMADVGWTVPPELLRLPGDVDADADVDGADFLQWQRNLGGFGGSPGDFNGDLIVDGHDGWVLEANLGAVAAPMQRSGGAAVPEPAAGVLFGAGVVMVAGRVLLRRGRTAPGQDGRAM